ncbi:MAG: NAD+ synthase [Microgenomates group bacterium]|jgi:NAD+ synthase (glutamine-hydrolysing)
MKLELAQINTDPGCIEKNTQKIISYIEQAKLNKSDLIVFPELTIPGYMSMDLLLYSDYISQNKEALSRIVAATEGITAIVGFVDSDPNIIGPDGTPIRFNSAAILQNGKILGIEDKTLLPTYDVFYETRYFSANRSHKLYEVCGKKLGIEICEDLWSNGYQKNVTSELVEKGADVLINISASPFYLDKFNVRKNLIERVVNTYKKPFIYTNLVGSQDGYDGQLVFDGQSIVLGADGKLLGLGKAFEEDSVKVDLDNPKEILPQNTDSIDQLNKALVLGIKEYFRRSNFNKAFIGLSGGIDSAVVAALATQALGKENVTGITMPSRISSSGSVDDARKLSENLGINFQIIPIEETRKTLVGEISQVLQKDPKDLTNQNIQARIRGMILMAQANEENALVISTGNKTETALGYCTLYGDMAGGLAAISDVDKLKVYELANLYRKVIPRNSIIKEPSAELSENQTDEGSLGADYDLIVPIVNRLIEDRATIEEVLKEYPRPLVEKYWDLIIRNEHKRRQAAPGIKVTPKSFGIGRRIPISHEFRR